MKTTKRYCCHIPCDDEATKTVFYNYTDSGSNDFCENHIKEHTEGFIYESIIEIENCKFNDFIKILNKVNNMLIRSTFPTESEMISLSDEIEELIKKSTTI